MSSEWITATLSELCASIDYGYTAAAVQQPVGPKFLRITDIRRTGLDWSIVPHVIVEPALLPKYRLHHGDVVVARTGAFTGHNAFVQTPPEAIFASYLVRLKAKPGVEPRFLYFFMQSPTYSDYVAGAIGGSAQPNASAKVLTGVEVPVPPLSEQLNIVRLLGAIDDKIDLNRKMNRALEGMARAVFKSWFVDFDPVVTKAAGKPPFGLSPSVAALFTSEFIESDRGPVPRGWRLVPFAVLVDIVGGGTPKTSVPEYWGGDLPWFSVVDTPDPGDVFVLDTEKRITEKGLKESAVKLLEEGTTIITARGTVGNVALVGRPMAMNQSCYGLVGKAGLGPYFVYYATLEVIEDLLQRTHGSVFDTITRATFDSVASIEPPLRVAQAFDEYVSPLLGRIKANREESRALTQLRILLLPRLLSGEIRVGQAESLLEHAL